MIHRLLTLLLLVAPGPAVAADRIAGPVEARVLRVIDGDTIEVAAALWIGLTLTALVRIRGIDAPEIRGACPLEKDMAAAARQRLAEVAGETVVLADVEQDKYAGRVVADVRSPAGVDFGKAMIASGLARPYDGRSRADWCPVGSVSD